tara:strand:- start:572 stop:994 length:423 start_codon:yes stop_codon:yes gene_type:complete
MPYPFLNKHSEKQYIELETNFLNLFNFVQSLMTHTEGEHLDSNSQKLIHFNALCIRVSEGVERFSDFAEQVRDVMFKGDSATTTPIPEPAGDIQIRCNQEEYALIIEALEHMACSFPDLKIADQFQAISDDIKNLKKEKK